MKALILAAGRGTRLKHLTDKSPKCLLSINGKTILDHQLEALQQAGIKEVTIVIGHGGHQIKNRYGRWKTICFVENPKYYLPGNLSSLWFARYELDGSFMMIYADVLFSVKMLIYLLSLKGDFCLLVDKKPCGAEDMKVAVQESSVVEIGKEIHPERTFGEFIGVSKYSAEGARVLQDTLNNIQDEDLLGADFSILLEHLIATGHRITYGLTAGRPWIEIDFQEDLETARREVYPLILREQNT